MKDFNFDKLKNVKTPDSWIENAVNIPNVQKKPKKVIPFNTRVVATAACLTFCFVLGSVMLSIVNTDPTAVVRPLTEPTTENPNNNSQNKTETKGYNYSSDPTLPKVDEILPVIILPNGETITLYPTNNTDSFYSEAEVDEVNKGNVGSHTGNASVSKGETTVTFATEPEETVSVPTEFPTEPVVTEPTEQTTIATTPTYTQPVTQPTIRPTYTHPVTLPTEPCETEPVTEGVNPTPPPSATEQPTFSSQPTFAPTEPTISTVPSTENKLFKNSVIFYPENISDYTNDGNVYCHIIGADGREYAQKFSSAEVSSLKDNYIVYSPYNSLETLTMEKNKYYDIYFYTKSHTSKTYRCYLGANNYYIIE